VPAEGGGIDTVSEAQLIPLGGDRFLYTKAGRNKIVGTDCVAFFGDDGQGRAANFVDTFPAKRVSAQVNEKQA